MADSPFAESADSESGGDTTEAEGYQSCELELYDVLDSLHQARSTFIGLPNSTTAVQLMSANEAYISSFGDAVKFGLGQGETLNELEAWSGSVVSYQLSYLRALCDEHPRRGGSAHYVEVATVDMEKKFAGDLKKGLDFYFDELNRTDEGLNSFNTKLAFWVFKQTMASEVGREQTMISQFYDPFLASCS